MSIIGTVYEDVTTDVLGDIGSWQWLVTFVSAILTLPCFFNQYEDMFLLHASNEVICLPPSSYLVTNVSLCTFSNGTATIACNRWHIQLMWMFWFKKSWLMFCDDELKLFSTAMICRLGLVFGFVIFGLISDSFGRRMAIMLAVISEVTFRTALVFCNSEAWFRLFVFLGSLFGSANLYMSLILVCEIASNRWRTWLTLIVSSPRLTAMVCTVPLANSAPNSETYTFISCVLAALLVGVLRWTPESPQWLLYNRKILRAEKMLHKAANRNGFKYSGEFKIRPVNHRAYACLDEPTTCIGILTTYNIRVIFILSIIFWLLFYFLWGSLYLRVYSDKGLSRILIEILCCISVSGCLTVLLAAKLKLRYLLMINIILTGAFTASTIFFKQETLHSLLSSLAIGSAIIGHALVLNITPRLFAINVRATSYGCCHATGQLGAMISYLMFLFKVMDDITFATVEIGVALTLTAMCYVVPDVDGRELPDVMEDMDYFRELSKPLRWATQKRSSPSKEEVVIKIYSFGSGRAVSTHSRERPQARPVGPITLWRMMRDYMRKKFRRESRHRGSGSPRAVS